MKLKLWQTIGLIVVLLLIIGAVVLAVRAYQGEYSVVYVTSGEIYVGKLSTFPRLMLTDAHAITTAKNPSDPAKANTILSDFSTTVWAPKQVYLNPDQVIFYGPLAENSRALEGLRNPGAFKPTSEIAPTPKPPVSQ